MGKIKQQIAKFKYPLLALVLGLAIMLIPTGADSDNAIDPAEDEQRLALILSKCDGVGQVSTLLSENGAIIVCDGADNAAVRLNVTNAVEAFTGFSSDRIQVIKTAPNIGG